MEQFKKKTPQWFGYSGTPTLSTVLSITGKGYLLSINILNLTGLYIYVEIDGIKINANALQVGANNSLNTFIRFNQTLLVKSNSTTSVLPAYSLD